MSNRPCIFLSVLALLAPLASAQTIAEAPDSPPGLTWKITGTVTPLNNTALSHDGVDVVQIDPISDLSNPWPSISAPVTVPSVVEFWHRSQDYDATTKLGRSSVPAAISGGWRQERWMHWPITARTSGVLEIANLGTQGK